MPHTPAELAKETLLRLAQQRVPPTPEHYARMYAELSGSQEPLPSERLEKLLALDWSGLMRRLIATWELPHRDWTTEHKRRSLERVLATRQPELLYERLNRLIEAWKRSPSQETIHRDEETSSTPEAELASHDASHEGTQREEVTKNETTARFLIAGSTLGEPQNSFAASVNAGADDHLYLIACLQRILATLLRNIDILLPQDGWLKGQVALLREHILHRAPEELETSVLQETEARLSDTIEKESRLISAKRQAEQEVKQLLAKFLDEIASITSVSADFQQELEHAADVIEQARDISELTPLLGQLLEQTRSLHEHMRRSHRELSAARDQAEAAQRRVQELEEQLAALSEQVISDPLTGVLNRRGIEQMFQIEQQRAVRSHQPFSLAILDVDNFKQLNDTLGHQAGDEALKHLVRMSRKYLRRTDIVGRYGGEEFIVLLPETPVEAAAEVIRRVQRGLTRELFFYQDAQRVITFSAGVTIVGPQDAFAAAVARADEGLYEAKRTGKNRVVVKNP